MFGFDNPVAKNNFECLNEVYEGVRLIVAVGFYKAHLRTSPAEKGLTFWLLLVMLIVFLLLSHVVSWVRCGT